MAEHFLLEKEGRIATLRFNRPEKRNPLNEEIILEMESLLQQVRDDREARVLVVTGTGNTFSAGADLSTLKGVTDPQERQRLFIPLGKRRGRLVGRMLRLLANLEQITIAAINGFAIGGGWAIALACDFRLAVEGAEFWFPEVDLGVPLSPESSALLTALVGPSLAKEIIITCRHYKAEELLPLGLVNHVVPAKDLVTAAYNLARTMANKNPNAVTVTKATVNALAEAQSVIRPDLLMIRED
ncbi:MAG: enoyl-CoA hydratase/isomerase family protein [Deltaproteobacteria bacterium]|nr:enoyl-CoA hydratase/isomerase family protein [Deltaproteobacteria bacterium]